MFEAFLVTTSTEGLRPLGTAAQRSFELMTGTVASRVGAEHAQLFAEPVAAEHGDMIDWHAPIAGTATRLSEVSQEEQTELRARLGSLVADIRAEADSLADSSDPQDQRLSEALANAIEVPDETMIHAIRGQDGALHPVLTHWAWVRDEQKSVRGVLTGMIPRAGLAGAGGVAAGAGDAGQAVRGSFPWWWLILLGWLLLAAMLAYILYLMIAPCGLNNGRVLFCQPPDPEISAIPGERRVLEDEIAALKREITLLDRGCQPTIPILPAPVVPDAPKTDPVLPVFPTPTEPAPEQTTPEPVPDQSPAEDAEAPVAVPDEAAALAPEAVEQQLEDRGARRGALNFALSWTSTDDIDLSVACPTGQVISYTNRVDCGGSYDLDANVARADAVMNPVENVVFDEIVPGVYTVRALLKGNRTAGDKPVTLHVLRQDGRSETYSGIVNANAPEWAVNISISR